MSQIVLDLNRLRQCDRLAAASPQAEALMTSKASAAISQFRVIDNLVMRLEEVSRTLAQARFSAILTRCGLGKQRWPSTSVTSSVSEGRETGATSEWSNRESYLSSLPLGLSFDLSSDFLGTIV